MSSAPTGDYTPGSASSTSVRTTSLIPEAPSTTANSTVAAGDVAGSPSVSTAPSTRFRILRDHAQGGLGKVSVAYDTQLRRQVALKEMRPDRRNDERLRQRFMNEAEITGQLEHPGIVPVYALEQADGQPFYVMRFVRGRTLSEAIKEFHRQPSFRSLFFRDLLKRFVDVCQTMAYAHEQGIIHRDLKPDNVLLGPHGESLVLDWGLAKKVLSPGSHLPTEDTTAADAALSTQDSGLTSAGQVLGTPAFMAPEQAAGRADVGPAADVYALGAILYQLLTSRPPFAGTPAHALLEQLEQGRPPPAPRSRNPAVPRALEAICLRAMASQPDARYPSASALAEDVNRWLADEPVSAWREPLAARLVRLNRRQPKVALLGLGLLVVMGLGIGASTYLWRLASAARDRSDRMLGVSIAMNDAFDEAAFRYATGPSFLDKRGVLRYKNPLLAAPIFQAWVRSAADRWQQLHAEDPGNPRARVQYARARQRLAEMEQRIDPDLLRETEALAEEHPEHLSWLASLCERMAGQTTDAAERTALRTKAVTAYERLEQRQADARPLAARGFALVNASLGEASPATLRLAEQARDVFASNYQQHPNAEPLMMQLAAMLRQAIIENELGKREAAVATASQAIRLGQDGLQRHGNHVALMQTLAKAYGLRGDLATPLQSAAAARDCAEAVRLCELVVAAKLQEATQYNDARVDLAARLHNLGLTQVVAFQAQARATFARNERLCTELLAIDPDDVDVRWWLAVSCFRQAVRGGFQAISPTDVPLVQRARAELATALRAQPDRLDVRTDLGLVLFTLGNLEQVAGRFEQAHTLLTEARAEGRQVWANNRDNTLARDHLTNTLTALAKTQRALKQSLEAARTYQELAELWPDNRLVLYQALCGLGQCAKLADASQRGPIVVAAVRLLPQLQRAGFTDADRLVNDEDLAALQGEEEWRHALGVLMRR